MVVLGYSYKQSVATVLTRWASLASCDLKRGCGTRWDSCWVDALMSSRRLGEWIVRLRTAAALGF